MIKTKDKAGINRPIICSRCKKRVGYVRIKTRFRVKIIFWIFVLAIVTQIISEIIGRVLLGDYK